MAELQRAALVTTTPHRRDRGRTATTTARRRVPLRTGVVVLAMLAGIATIPATALAGSWGPNASYYSGIKRVTASGTMTRYSNRSRSVITTCDQHNEGWPVYGYSDWTEIGSTYNVQTRATAQTGGCITGDWSIGWASPAGWFVRAKGCAQVGWPVPDNCTAYNAEAHRP